MTAICGALFLAALAALVCCTRMGREAIEDLLDGLPYREQPTIIEQKRKAWGETRHDDAR